MTMHCTNSNLIPADPQTKDPTEWPRKTHHGEFKEFNDT